MAATNASTSLPRVPIPPRGVNYRGKVVLAPMVRSGELPMRLLSLHYGADLVWGVFSLLSSPFPLTHKVLTLTLPQAPKQSTAPSSAPPAASTPAPT